MKVFTCKDHDTFYPVGGASVIIANDWNEAVSLLDAALIKEGLKPRAERPYTLQELPESPVAVVLNDGEY